MKRRESCSRRAMRKVTVLGALLITTVGSLLVAQSTVVDSAEMERRIEAALDKLTVEQKIELLGGEDGFFIRAEPAIGLPRMRMSDGPVGLRNGGPGIAYPAGIALAAAWDPELAQRVGEALGEDARARGVHFLLGPGVNLYRAPMAGRNFEYFGEDPYLAARTAVGYIHGVQSRGVIATVKHFAANNQEYDRHHVSSDVDERTLRELYLPAFEAAVTDAKVGAVMNSYNLVNGIHATQNAWLNHRVLKGDWGFQGVLMSDWNSTYDGVAAAKSGLDLEMPSGKFMNPGTLLPALKDGRITQREIDDKVRRILRVAIQFSFTERPQLDMKMPVLAEARRRVALDEARESIVLLKNDGDLLPLDSAHVKTIALLGPGAWPAVTGGGGSSEVAPFSAVSLLGGLTAVRPDVKVLYLRGIPTLEEIARSTVFDGKVSVTHFSGRNQSGDSTETFSPGIDTMDSDSANPPQADGHSMRYHCRYTAKAAGIHYVVLDGNSGDDYRLLIDGKQQVLHTANESWTHSPVALPLRQGQTISIGLDYQPHTALTHVRLGIASSSDLVSEQAKHMAAIADVAIVAVGFDRSNEGEGSDRNYALPLGQTELIEAVEKANPKTVVTATAGGEVDPGTWLAKTPAVLHLWYPGQEGGTAVAEILFGDRSPEGKLPITYAHSWLENPTHDFYYPQESEHVNYGEGLMLGYRYFTTKHRTPLFPFGYGLTYTQFRFANLKIVPDPASRHDFDVSFEVTNTGARAAAEVAQVYVGDPSAIVPRPALELKGFQKVRLRPSETTSVVLHLNERSLAYWDVAGQRWRLDVGKFVVQVGSSSADAALLGSFVVR